MFFNNSLKSLDQIFPTSSINEQIKDIQNTINYDILPDDVRKIDNELKQKRELLHYVNPFTVYIKIFIKLMLNDENTEKNAVFFEKFLNEFKRDKLKHLREARVIAQEKLDIVNQNINHSRNRIKKLEENKKILIAKEKKELDEFNIQKNELKRSIKNLDNQMELIDLTLYKFWDEIFEIYDWIIEMDKLGIDYRDAETIDKVSEFKAHIDHLLDHYVKLVNNGFPIHISRGKMYKLQSRALERVFQKLNFNNELFIVSAIGEQSSDKSLLINALFGCNFRTSAGRCTLGMNMHFADYMDKKDCFT